MSQSVGQGPECRTAGLDGGWEVTPLGGNQTESSVVCDLEFCVFSVWRFSFCTSPSPGMERGIKSELSLAFKCNWSLYSLGKKFLRYILYFFRLFSFEIRTKFSRTGAFNNLLEERRNRCTRCHLAECPCCGPECRAGWPLLCRHSLGFRIWVGSVGLGVQGANEPVSTLPLLDGGHLTLWGSRVLGPEPARWEVGPCLPVGSQRAPAALPAPSWQHYCPIPHSPWLLVYMLILSSQGTHS